ncbi:hypothetical protein D9611_004998 [Ephemerocybe angulata]|uniref:Uncharacterized protein n=1 Tax=Ephemerocybe angulata TaxID=980116 RepID=A0A8H5B2Q2_9AGAR|nr:hypothetical protein D9611_004998 [Tulosesus angulatus]
MSLSTTGISRIQHFRPSTTTPRRAFGAQFPYSGAGAVYLHRLAFLERNSHTLELGSALDSNTPPLSQRKLTYMESSILSFGNLMEQNVRIWCWAQTDLNGFTHPQPQIWNCLMDLSAFAST